MTPEEKRQLVAEMGTVEKFPEMEQTEWPDSFPSAVDGGDESLSAVLDSRPQMEGDGEQQQEFPQTMPAPPDEVQWPESMPANDAYAFAAPQDSPFPQMQQQQGEDGSVSFSMYSPPGQENVPGTGMPSGSEGVPANQQDMSLYTLLQQIANGISALSGAKTPEQSASSQYQYPWADQGFAPLEQTEDYAAASPAINATTLSGARGAGGFGYGSNFANRSGVDLFEPGARHS